MASRRNKRSPVSMAIAQAIMNEYQPKNTEEMQETIKDKVLSVYAKGMSQRDIADTIEDIYGFEISHDTISSITDRVIGSVNEWQNRPLKKFYAFLFVDCLYVSIRKEAETKRCRFTSFWDMTSTG